MDSLNAILTVLLYMLKLSAKLVDGYCYGDAQCSANRSCCSGFCIQSSSCKGFCRNNWDCPNNVPVCDIKVNKCISGCFAASDCPTSYACVSGTCEKKWRHGSSDPKKDNSIEPFSNIEESSSILGLMIAGIVALIFFAWICCQCFRFRLRRQELQLRGYRFDEPSATSPNSNVCDHNFFSDPDNLTYYDRNSANFESIYSRSSCRLSLDIPPRYSALFLDQGTGDARTPPPTYDEALRIVQLTTTCTTNASPRTSVSTQVPSPQGIGTVV